MIKLTKTLFIFFFLLLFVSFVISPLVCLSEEIFSTAPDHSFCIDQPNQL